MDFVQTLIGVLVGGGLIGFIEFLIKRKDDKAEKNSDVIKRLEKLDEKIDNLEAAEAERNAVLARTHILRFNDEIYNGIHHSKEYFEQTLDDIIVYNRFCDSRPEFANGRTKMAAENIEQTFRKLYAEHKL